MHLFSLIPWCFQVFGWVVSLAIWMPNIYQAGWLCFFKESCLQSHSRSSSCLAAAAVWDYRQLFIIRCSFHDGLIVQTKPVCCAVRVDPVQHSFVLCSRQGCCLISWAVSITYKYLAFCHKLRSWVSKCECWNPSSSQVCGGFVTNFNGVRCLCHAGCLIPIRQ